MKAIEQDNSLPQHALNENNKLFPLHYFPLSLKLNIEWERLSFKVSGKYWDSCWDDKKKLAKPLSHDEQLQEELWRASERLLSRIQLLERNRWFRKLGENVSSGYFERLPDSTRMVERNPLCSCFDIFVHFITCYCIDCKCLPVILCG